MRLIAPLIRCRELATLAGWSSFELASWAELSIDERRAFIKEGLLMSSTGTRCRSGCKDARHRCYGRRSGCALSLMTPDDASLIATHARMDVRKERRTEQVGRETAASCSNKITVLCSEGRLFWQQEVKHECSRTRDLPKRSLRSTVWSMHTFRYSSSFVSFTLHSHTRPGWTSGRAQKRRFANRPECRQLR